MTVGRARVVPVEVEEVQRSFTPRRTLPNGRAVIGGCLVATAAIGTFAVATNDAADLTTGYLVLVDDIEPGETLGPSDVRLESMVLSTGLAANALQSPDEIVGSTALFHLRAGSVVDGRDLRPVSAAGGPTVTGTHEVTIPVTPDRSPAALQRGDRVAILAFAADDETLHTATEDALVLGFEAESTGIGTVGAGRLTLALDSAEAVAAVVRWSYQPLTVVLTTRAIDDVYPETVVPVSRAQPDATAAEEPASEAALSEESASEATR